MAAQYMHAGRKRSYSSASQSTTVSYSSHRKAHRNVIRLGRVLLLLIAAQVDLAPQVFHPDVGLEEEGEGRGGEAQEGGREGGKGEVSVPSEQAGKVNCVVCFYYISCVDFRPKTRWGRSAGHAPVQSLPQRLCCCPPQSGPSGGAW